MGDGGTAATCGREPVGLARASLVDAVVASLAATRGPCRDVESRDADTAATRAEHAGVGVRERARPVTPRRHGERSPALAPVAIATPVRRAAQSLLVVALAAQAGQAGADLWVYRDETGKAHFAPTQVDPRYTLFYKGTTNLDVPPAPAPIPPDFEGAAEIIRNRVSGHPNVARYTPLIERHASLQGLDVALVKAVVAVESAFDPQAVSPKGAVGLMQVIPATAERYGVRGDAKRSIEQQLKDPSTNVRVGTRYLADLLERFGNDAVLALAGYNAGEYAVERYDRRVPPFPETRAYVKLVQQFREFYAPPPPPPPKPSRPVIPRRGSP